MSTEYVVQNCLEVAEKSPFDKVGVLVYASHKRFGGGYRNHSKAQEEYLFNNTNLPDKSPPSDYYPLAHKDSGGFALVANSRRTGKEIVFIFVPAPVWKINSSTDVLNERARVIFRLAKIHEVEHLVLGGWGCGVFGCPPALVSRVLHEHSPDDIKITYAFLDPKLKKVFEEENG